MMLRETYALFIRELKHWYRAKVQIFMMLIQPIVWLGLFGQAFPIKLPPVALNGAPDYMSYMSVGMLAVTALFTCMFAGMSVVWDRRFGFLNKLRAAPISRGSIPVSRVMAAMVRAVISALLVLLIALLFAHIPGLQGLTVTADFGILNALGILLILMLLATAFAAIFVAISLTIKTQETLFAVINLLNLPLMFASAALFPITGMPDWLQAVAKVNPLTLAVDGMRQLLFAGSEGIYPIGVDILGLLAFSLVLVSLGIVVAMRALKEK
ncbi:MAG: ABC-2 type transporter [Methanomassiliicoccales archaeon PtaU1.Bin124]|nr:MAG: ABC-2 type transporter [Methanomassiliicoccales archaeon PtaU1.Bin124]